MLILPLAIAGCSGNNKTDEVTVVAVAKDGTPRDGWTVSPDAPIDVDCSAGQASPSSRTDGMRSCDPVALHADVCWPAKDPGTLLCAESPWEKQLRRANAGGPLQPVAKPADAQPWGLELGDGTKCQLRRGGGWGGGPDNSTPVYGCLSGDLAVLQMDNAPVIDKSKAKWTVKVGPIAANPDPRVPAPQVVEVAKAYFTGTDQ
ncbi:MAG: hypothetical protein QM728_08450 [Gordonia sp. (in: high G+C Gram-positive bacteria)]|uniref:hypothetical protein n=1 Tax=Gordonia sp. (in: high G+C Gram-positive bacteria) TaxID=84139 RepID=UPI0039E5165E